MPSSRASRRAHKWASTSFKQSRDAVDDGPTRSGSRQPGKKRAATPTPSATTGPPTDRADSTNGAPVTAWPFAFEQVIGCLSPSARDGVRDRSSQLSTQMKTEARRTVLGTMAACAAGHVSASRVVSRPKRDAKGRPARISITAGDWAAGFGLLAHGLPPQIRTEIAQACRRLAAKASSSRLDVLGQMRDSIERAAASPRAAAVAQTVVRAAAPAPARRITAADLPSIHTTDSHRNTLSGGRTASPRFKVGKAKCAVY